MNRIALFTLFLLAVLLASAYAANPHEIAPYRDASEKVAIRLWDSVEAHPVPVALALGTFLLTVVYHKVKGKSLRESLEVAATRVAVVPVVQKEPAEPENPVVARAKARTTRTQLIADKIGLQNRQRKLPVEVQQAEREVCYTEQAVADLKRLLGEKHKAHNAAIAALKLLRKEKAEAEAELAAIDAELKKLAARV